MIKNLKSIVCNDINSCKKLLTKNLRLRNKHNECIHLNESPYYIYNILLRVQAVIQYTYIIISTQMV